MQPRRLHSTGPLVYRRSQPIEGSDE